MTIKKPPYRPFAGKVPDLKYVAFIDILGFSDFVKNKFDRMIIAYQNILEHWKEIDKDYYYPDVSIRIYSDSILLSSSDFIKIVGAINLLHMVTLSENFLIRGGVGFGKHIEVIDNDNFYVLSHALIDAATIEKTIKYPCVAISPSMNVDMGWWNPYVSNFLRKLLYFEDAILVNPFNIAWGYSAMTRVKNFLKEYPQHREKYEWFLSLYDAVSSGRPLIPDWVIEQF
jgi:hypothetical protein